MRLVIVFSILIYFNVCYATEAIQIEINNLNWHEVIYNVLDFYHSNNIKAENLEKYTHEYGELYLYMLAEIESDFRNVTGQVNKLDKGIFQIYTGFWSYEKLSLLSGHSVASESDLLDKQVSLAAHIWLYNICIYRSTFNRYPKNTVEVLAVYHNPNKLSNAYMDRIKHVLNRNSIKIINF